MVKYYHLYYIEEIRHRTDNLRPSLADLRNGVIPSKTNALHSTPIRPSTYLSIYLSVRGVCLHCRFVFINLILIGSKASSEAACYGRAFIKTRIHFSVDDRTIRVVMSQLLSIVLNMFSMNVKYYIQGRAHPYSYWRVWIINLGLAEQTRQLINIHIQ